MIGHDGKLGHTLILPPGSAATLARKPLGLGVPCQPAASTASGVFASAVSNLGHRKIQQALRDLNEAESLGHAPGECAAQRWFCWMLLGDFERAWQESDAIASYGTADPLALWDRRPFQGGRVIVRCLHGYGDAIQFLRYTQLLRESAASIVVETHPEMVSLLSGLRFGGLPVVDEVVPWSDRTDWDQQIEVTELPRAFRTTLKTIPCAMPYLEVGSEGRARSAKLLGSPNNQPRVGLVWQSSPWNPARSASLDAFRPLLDTPCSFYSFQRGPAREELNNLGFRGRIHDTAGHSPGIADTAADLTHMDLVVTVDTMAAHLAGALGRPVFTLLPWEADWRWMLEREDTPWYPTMRLFRQTTPGDWSDPMSRIAQEISRTFPNPQD